MPSTSVRLALRLPPNSAAAWVPGWNAGLMWAPSADLRFGLAYRSKVSHELHGSADFSKPSTLPATINGLPALTNSGTHTNLTLPESVAISAFYQANETWAFMGAATWVRWSHDKELRTRFDNGASDSVIPLNWENTWRISAAVSYKMSPALTLRTGVAYDQSPTTSAALQTLLIPDADRWVLGIGGSYGLSKAMSIDFAASHYFFKNLPITQTANCKAASAELIRMRASTSFRSKPITAFSSVREPCTSASFFRLPQPAPATLRYCSPLFDAAGTR